MVEPKLEVPAELRDLAEKTIDQAEKAFGLFFDAASNRAEYEGCVRTCAKIGSCHRPSTGDANSIRVLEESVYKRRRTYEANHRRGHVRREGCIERQILIRCPEDRQEQFTSLLSQAGTCIWPRLRGESKLGGTGRYSLWRGGLCFRDTAWSRARVK